MININSSKNVKFGCEMIFSLKRVIYFVIITLMKITTDLKQERIFYSHSVLVSWQITCYKYCTVTTLTTEQDKSTCDSHPWLILQTAIHEPMGVECGPRWIGCKVNDRLEIVQEEEILVLKGRG